MKINYTLKFLMLGKGKKHIVELTGFAKAI